MRRFALNCGWWTWRAANGLAKLGAAAGVGRESRSINLSLHFLEQIIVALQARLSHYDAQGAPVVIVSKLAGPVHRNSRHLAGQSWELVGHLSAAICQPNYAHRSCGCSGARGRAAACTHPISQQRVDYIAAGQLGWQLSHCHGGHHLGSCFTAGRGSLHLPFCAAGSLRQKRGADTALIFPLLSATSFKQAR